MKTQTSWAKRIVALLLAVTMVIGMVGCGKRAETEVGTESGKNPTGNVSTDKLPTDYDREDMELIVDLVGNGQSTDGLSDKELNDLVDDLISNMGDQSSNTSNLGSSTEVEKPESGWVKDESAYDENGAMTKPFDQVYPEMIESGAVKFSAEQLLIKLKSGKLTDGLKAAGVAALEEIVPMGDCAWYVAKLTDGTDAKEALAAVRELKEVLLAEYDYQMQAAADDAANIKEQWHLSAKEYGISEAEEYLSEKEGSIPGGASSVIVAVIDTGVDIDHEDLKDNIWVNTKEIPDNGIDDDGNGYVDDYYGVNIVNRDNGGGNGDDDHGHGTHVAGIIAAQKNNLGVTGIAYNVQIMTIKAGNHSGIFNDSDVVAAILYAYNHGAEVINMSFGGSSCSLAMQDALATAYSRCVLVASAGNNSAPNEFVNATQSWQPNYPAALTYVLGVMSVREDGWVSAFSNWDVQAHNGVEYEVAAPGEAIMSTLPNDRYGAQSGTSMAAPVVSAMAAILRSEYSDRGIYPNKFIYGQLAATSDNLATCNNPQKHRMGNKGHDLPQIVNLYDALTKMPEPEVNLQDYAYFDDPQYSEKNNGDGVIDAGETIALGLYLQNRWGASIDTMVTIDTLSDSGLADPYITIHNPTVNYGGVGTYSVGTCGELKTESGLLVGWENPFLITIADNCPNDYRFTLNVTIECKNGMDEKDETIYTTTGSLMEAVRSGKVLPSIIEEDMVLTADNLYIISESTVIMEGYTVRVEPGTHIQFWSNDPGDPYADKKIAYLAVNGEFRVEGTPENPVYLYPSQLMDYYLVNIQRGSSGYVSLEYAECTNFDGAVNYAEGCKFTLNYLAGLKYRTISSDGSVSDSSQYRIYFGLDEAVDCVFYKLGYKSGMDLSGSYRRSIFVDCALNFGGAVLQDCVLLGNALVDVPNPSPGYLEGPTMTLRSEFGDIDETELQEYLNSGWIRNATFYRPETGTTYLFSYSGNLHNQRRDYAELPVKYVRLLGGDYAVMETEEEWQWFKENVMGKSITVYDVKQRPIGYDRYLSYDFGLVYDRERNVFTWHDGTEVGEFADPTGLAKTAKGNDSLVYVNAYEYDYITGQNKDISELRSCPLDSDTHGEQCFVVYEFPGEILPTEITLSDYEIVMDTQSDSYQIELQSLPVTLEPKQYLYESSNPAVVVVSDTGLVTPVGVGEAEVYVYSLDKAVSNYIAVTVKDPVPLEMLQFPQESIELSLGKTYDAAVSFVPADTTKLFVKYTSSNPEAVTVDRFGKLTAVGSGTATITAVCDGKSVTMEVTAYVKAGSLKLDTTGFVAVYTGEENNTVDLPAVITPKGSEPKFSWRSTNTEVADVDRSGKLVLNGTGTTTLIVEDVRSGLSDSCLVIVQREKPADIKDMKIDYENSYVGVYGFLTEAGELYAWGHDYSNKITSPTLVATNVEAFALSAAYSGYTQLILNYLVPEITDEGQKIFHLYSAEIFWNGETEEYEWKSTELDTDVSVLCDENIIDFEIEHYYPGVWNKFVCTESGKAYAWGNYNSYGQLGVGTADEVTSPTLVQLAGVRDIESGQAMITWLLTDDGKLYQAGFTNGSEITAVPALRAADVVSISVADGGNMCYALTKDGATVYIYCNGGKDYGSDYSSYEPVKSVMESYRAGAFVSKDGSAYYVDGSLTKLDIENAVDVYGGDGTYYFVTKENLVYGVGYNNFNQLAGATAETEVEEAVLVPVFGLPTDRLKVESNLTQVESEVDGELVYSYELQAHFTDKLVLTFNHPINSANVMLYERVGKDGEFKQIFAEKAIVNLTDLEVWLTNGFMEKTELDYPITYRAVIQTGGVSTKLGLTNDAKIEMIFTFVGREKEEVIQKAERVIHESVTNPDLRRYLTPQVILEELSEYEEKNQYNPEFYGNAVLNRYRTDTDPTHWLRPTAPGVSAGAVVERRLGGNYWGTTDKQAIELQMVDYIDFKTMARLMYEPYLMEAPENTFPFVTSVRLLNANGEEVSTVGNEEVTFVVTFNRDMDTTMPLSVSFGSAYPYADYSVEGAYVDARTWQGTYTLRTIIENGQQYIKVSNGRAIAEDAAGGYLELFADEGRYGFTIDTSAAQALIMQGEAMDTGIRLWWMQDDFDTLLGYNIYRCEYETGLYSRINSVSIPADTKEFFDDTVEPGKLYYYYFTVIKTDLTESEPSGRISLMSKDTMAPNIYHSPVTLATMAQNLIVSASVTDNLSIAYADLYYRTAGAEEWKLCRMNALNDRYSAIIPADQLSAEGLEYYIVAFDGVSYTYCGSAETPYFVQVQQALDKNALGDVNGDGVITNLDALMLLQHISGKVYLTAEQFARADLNQDNALHAVEALRILKYISGEVGSLDMSGEVLQ